MKQEDLKLAVIGLGYVGLPLAAEFAKYRQVIGFDIDAERVAELQGGFDRTREVSRSELASATGLKYSCDPADLADCNCYIVTVPTPVDSYNRPDLSALLAASELIGNVMSPGDIVIYESTVYPGATEDDCGPVLAKNSGLSYATETMPASSQVFYLGYSPERINPGDKAHRVKDIVKVTSGSTPEIAALIDDLYASIITAGTFRAANIRVAEAAKVIENTQRDVNIALINELTVIFEKIGMDTESVLKAAETKWNFLPFRPGLVGGHCIGVDPYYLTHKAQQLGHNPEIILAGRRINDKMSAHVADRLIKLMLRHEINPLDARVLVLGLTFKENCPDTRNSKVMDLINSLSKYNCRVDVHDPQIDPGHMSKNFNGTIVAHPNNGAYDAILLAVAHDEFVQMGAEQLRRFGKTNHVLFDLKYAFPGTETDERL